MNKLKEQIPNPDLIWNKCIQEYSKLGGGGEWGEGWGGGEDSNQLGSISLQSPHPLVFTLRENCMICALSFAYQLQVVIFTPTLLGCLSNLCMPYS